MKITHETVSAFARKNGTVTIMDTLGRATVLPSGERDSIGLVDEADRFQFQGKWYTRGEFEKVLDGPSS
jgi:hypothetical protein